MASDESHVEFAKRGLQYATLLMRDFYEQNDYRPVQRMTDVETGLDDTLEHTAATLSTAAEALREVMHDADRRLLRGHLHVEECSEFLVAMAKRDEVEVLDALADMLYVIIGSAVIFDLPIAEAFVEVHRSNMTKEPSNDTRMCRKGPNYSPPDLRRILDEYRKA